MEQGELFSMQFCQDIPWVLACGGSKGEIAIWDTSESLQIEEHFKGNLIKGSYNQEDYDENAIPDPQEDDGFEDISSDGEKKQKKKKKSKK